MAVMSYDINVSMGVSAHDIGEQWNRKLTEWGTPYRIDAQALAKWSAVRQWEGFLPVMQNPPIGLEACYSVTHEQYTVTFTTSLGTLPEWEAIWLCSAALAVITDGTLFDPQTDEIVSAENAYFYAQAQIAAFETKTTDLIRSQHEFNRIYKRTSRITRVLSLGLFLPVVVLFLDIPALGEHSSYLRFVIMAGLMGLTVVLMLVVNIRAFSGKQREQAD